MSYKQSSRKSLSLTTVRAKNNDAHTGFTIVELLIVIVVIAILAAVSIVAYIGITDRAASAVAVQEIKSNTTHLLTTGMVPDTIDVMPGGASALTMSKTSYKFVTYCTAGSDFVLAVQTISGHIFYSLNGGAVAQNDSLNIYTPCVSLGLSGAKRTYWLGLPASTCATENGSCSFSGTATVIFGSTTAASFTAKTNQTSPVSCSNTYFGTDPAYGLGKSCWAVQ